MTRSRPGPVDVAVPRFASVDWMRGATMALMIVVNNPGSWADMYAPLRHADWGGWLTPADMVFPFFLFLVGVSTPLALRSSVRRQTSRWLTLGRVLRRAAALFAIGLFLNLVPDFDLGSLRVMGVLQRIALVYVGGAVAFLWLQPRGLILLTGLILVGYALLLRTVPVPGVGEAVLTPETSLPVWIDEQWLGGHTWRGPGDPEGLLSTLGALANGLIGVLAGLAFVRPCPPARRSSIFLRAGSLTLVAGLVSTWMLPAVKEVWTSSYALISSGLALLVLAGLHRRLDGERPRLDLAALRTLGRHALTAYVLAHLYSDLSIHVLRIPLGGGETMSLHSMVYRRALASWMPPELASLTYSLLVLGLVWTLVWLWDRRSPDQEKRSPTSSIRS